MATPLFYRHIVALSRKTHIGLRLRRTPADYRFAASAILIPALAEEFSAAAGHLPIAFLPGAPQPIAVFVTGVTAGQNLFVGKDGSWRAGYVPAYLRRYPFILGDLEGGRQALCIDEAHDGFSVEGGMPLFCPDGRTAPLVDEALTLARRYHEAALNGEVFCRMLQEMKLLRSTVLEVRAPDGEMHQLSGLMTVDAAALDRLSEARMLELWRARYLGPIYAQMHSLKQVDKLFSPRPAPCTRVVAA